MKFVENYNEQLKSTYRLLSILSLMRKPPKVDFAPISLFGKAEGGCMSKAYSKGITTAGCTQEGIL